MIRFIQQRVPPGSEIIITLRTGKELRGILVNIDDEILTLENNDGLEYLMGTEITHFKVVRNALKNSERSGSNGNINDNTDIPQKNTIGNDKGDKTNLSPGVSPPKDETLTDIQPEQRQRTSTLSYGMQELVESPRVYPIEVLAAVIETQARFQASIRQNDLKPLDADFAFPENEIRDLDYNLRERIRSDWVRIQNAYQYANSVRELSRFNQIAERVNAFIEQYPDINQSYYNLGCLYLQINRISEAVRMFSTGSARFNHQGAWYNLAIVLLQRGERARACFALQEYFRRVQPSQNIQAWYICTGLLHDHAAYVFFKDMLGQAIEKERSDDARLIVDGFIYVLKSLERHEDALALAAYAQSRRLVSPDLVALVDVLIGRLGAEPLRDYVLARQEIESLAAKPAPAQPLQTPQAKPPAPTPVVQPQTGIIRSVAVRSESVSSSGSTSRKPSGPPRGQTSYQQAKYAQLERKDLQEAERLFRKAIAEGENVESATKDLASLLRQINRTPEAIELLSNYRQRADDEISIQNLLADMYQHNGDYAVAIEQLRIIVNKVPNQRRITLYRRIAFCYFKMRAFDQAETELNRLLKLSPNDTLALRWLEGLREAKRSGLYANLDAIFTVQNQLFDFSSSISKFLEFYLERCTYQGVPEAQVRSRNFSEADMRKLDGLIEGAGRRRPGLRAQYYLSVARLSLDLGLENELQVRESLQDFAGDMGDASLFDQRLPDVVMAFYSESFGVATRWNNRLRDRLSQYMMMLAYVPREEIAVERLPSPEAALRQALNNPARSLAVVEGLLELSVFNRLVAEALLPKMVENPRLCQQVADLCVKLIGEESRTVQTINDLAPLWERGRDFCRRRNQEVADEITFLQLQGSGLDTIREQIRRVHELEVRLRGQLDRKRLKNIGEILDLIYDYGREPQYSERERSAAIIKNRVRDEILDIEKNPTRFSLELFHPYMHTLNAMIEEHFSQVQKAAEPDQLRVNLAIEKYNVGQDERIECQVMISNEAGRSPASNLTINVLLSPAEEYTPLQQRVVVTEALQGGQSVTSLLPLQIKQKAKQAQVFSLYYRLSYTTRAGHHIETDVLTLPVQLGSAREFQSFLNPYAAHAEGTAVQDPKMFFGRDLLLERLVDAIGQSQTNKSFVIYGQKRTGKSSVLYHLRRCLIENYQCHRVIPIDFSIGDIVTEPSDTTFLYRIIQRIEDIFDFELPRYQLPSLSIQRPLLRDFLHSPALMFADFMRELRRTLDQQDAYRGARLVLLIDEFSYVYGEIVRGRLHDAFMKAWKGMLEKGYFGSVLAGQDVMRQFIDAYPNEFQVAQSERVTYLDEPDARALIVNPILIPETQESRYRGSAVERLVELTAGSPFYIQIFCNRLVEYMNRRHTTYVTDADISRIADDLIKGANAIGKDKFDNLITPGDVGTGLVPEADALMVLRAVALNTRTQTYCDRSSITVTPSIGLEVVLDDLEAREVLERPSGTLYRIRVGLFHRWLLTTA